MAKVFVLSWLMALLCCPVTRAAEDGSSEKKAAASNTPMLDLGRGISPELAEQFTKHFLSQFTVRLTPLTGPRLDGLIEGQLYAVDVDCERGVVSLSRNIVVYRDEKFTSFPLIYTDMDLPQLLAVINKRFKLRSDADAQKIQWALDVIYPVRSLDDDDGDDDPAVKFFRQDGRRWDFIRGHFFDKYAGFVFTTDDDGTITKISYLLGMKK